MEADELEPGAAGLWVLGAKLLGARGAFLIKARAGGLHGCVHREVRSGLVSARESPEQS